MTCPIAPKSRPRCISIAFAPSNAALNSAAWPAAHGWRRLERRHESGRQEGQRRKCLAGFLPLRRADQICRTGPPPQRHRLCRALPRPRPRNCNKTSSNTPGTANGIAAPTSTTENPSAPDQSGMPDRFPAAKLVGHHRRGRSRALPPGHAGRGRSASSAASRVDPAVRSALRQVLPQSRLHQRLYPRRARKWRPIHSCRHLDRHGLCPHGRQPARLGPVRPAQSRQPCNIAGEDRHLQESSPTSSPPTSMPSRRTPAAAVGPGTPVPPAGCIGCWWKPCSA